LGASEVLPAAQAAHDQAEPLYESTLPARHKHHELAFTTAEVWSKPMAQVQDTVAFVASAPAVEPAGHARHKADVES
jgi:hypothetical protein